MKVLRDSGPKASARVDRELRINRVIGNVSGVATTYQHTLTNDGHDCLVMPYFPKGTLAKFVRLPPQLSPRQIASISSWLAYVLERAHRRGVLHLDIKPNNILIDEDGHLFLADFGISWLRRPGEQTVKASLGYSEGFAPPEQVIGGKPDRRADVYALGATLTALLVGSPPSYDLHGNRSQVDHPAGAERLGAVLDRATAFYPEDRFAEAADLRAALCPGSGTPAEARVPTTAKWRDASGTRLAEPVRSARTASAEELDVQTSTSIAASAAVPRLIHTVSVAVKRRCPDCRGDSTGDFDCKRCNGDRRITAQRDVRFRLPDGFESGSTIKLPGHGSESAYGRFTGDAFVKVDVVPDQAPVDSPRQKASSQRQPNRRFAPFAPPQQAASSATENDDRWWQHTSDRAVRGQRLLKRAEAHYGQNGGVVRAVIQEVLTVEWIAIYMVWVLCAMAAVVGFKVLVFDAAAGSPTPLIFGGMEILVLVLPFILWHYLNPFLVVVDSRIALARRGRRGALNEVASGSFAEVRPSLVAALAGTKGRPKLQVGDRSVRVQRDLIRTYFAPAMGIAAPKA